LIVKRTLKSLFGLYLSAKFPVELVPDLLWSGGRDYLYRKF
jgi:hypothetical protein